MHDTGSIGVGVGRSTVGVGVMVIVGVVVGTAVGVMVGILVGVEVGPVGEGDTVEDGSIETVGVIDGRMVGVTVGSGIVGVAVTVGVRVGVMVGVGVFVGQGMSIVSPHEGKDWFVGATNPQIQPLSLKQPSNQLLRLHILLFVYLQVLGSPGTKVPSR
ncbi:hypothetical protein COV53_05935 [Candidatus Gottesmanbacteria bacterium CG11_big_fil_rev_8_21_14_0_20_37_11]|uniref:Uncharacterized protein n=2 Tax=Candidatus Gottesmaniibacteriota TaxID=1752720 RepID=A0A2H0NG74_9BACT|nr:MAG: hypothetical protein COV53_05935 [Candidatus Gottesmanbacteria bacterium CG11_big_fil_rev_8_21_14_0_20_37_11]